MNMDGGKPTKYRRGITNNKFSVKINQACEDKIVNELRCSKNILSVRKPKYTIKYRISIPKCVVNYL